MLGVEGVGGWVRDEESGRITGKPSVWRWYLGRRSIGGRGVAGGGLSGLLGLGFRV